MSDSGWIERELARELGAVAAPEPLWDRVAPRGAPRRKRSVAPALWPAVAALIVVTAGATVWRLARAQAPAAGMEALAGEELTRGARAFDFESADPAAMRAWVKNKTNITLDMRAQNGAVRLLGARILRKSGIPVVAVSYAVGDGQAALLVSRSRSGDQPGHLFARIGPAQRGVFSWSMREQTYALACSARNPRVACLLCHAGSAVN